MKRLRTAELSKLTDDELNTRLNDLRSELVTLRSKAARGILKKELGEIKTVRRNVARVMTAVSSARIAKSIGAENLGGKSKTSTDQPDKENS